MSFISVLGSLAAVAAVLGAVLAGAGLLRRYLPNIGRGRGVIALEVVQRIAVGPRQALTVVQVGERLIVVSAGDGGVRFIADVAREPAEVRAAQPDPDVMPGRLASAPAPFRDALTAAVRGMGAVARTVVVAAVLLMPAVDSVTAQGAPPSAGTAPAATAVARPSAARVDTMLARLAPQMQISVGSDRGGLRLSGTVGIVVMMGLMTLLPAVVLMMTGFTRILIVLNFLRQAIGAQSSPPMQLVAGLALLLTLFVMAPTIDEVNRTALSPWMDGRITQTEMLQAAAQPLRTFMLRQTRDADLEKFVALSRSAPVSRVEDVSLVVLMSAFVTSELRVAFQIGFALFLPFIVIDIVVAAVLMSMGMMMVPPAMISLPFKLLLFVLVDGWALVIQGLVQSFG